MTEKITYYCDKIDCYDEIKNFAYNKNKVVIDNVSALSNGQSNDLLLCDKHMKEFKDNYIKNAVTY